MYHCQAVNRTNFAKMQNTSRVARSLAIPLLLAILLLLLCILLLLLAILLLAILLLAILLLAILLLWPSPSTAALDRLGPSRCDDSSSAVH